MDQLDEVTILYEDAIILLEGFSLFQTLRACRSQVALGWMPSVDFCRLSVYVYKKLQRIMRCVQLPQVEEFPSSLRHFLTKNGD